MTGAHFQALKGCSLYATLQVDCAHVVDVTKTKTVFEFVCPPDMEIVEFKKCIGNCAHPCGWELLYDYKPNAGKSCDINNAKKAFEDILKFLDITNLTVDEYNKKIIGTPQRYCVQYNVATCACPKLDFDVCNFNLNVED